MIPVKIDATDYDYPSFQPDQILTAEDLNHVFNFLDLQERLTRTNLIGIGIVCGMHVSKSADGKTVTITKGSGVTSHGYLIVHGIENSEAPIDYKFYHDFDPNKDKKYDVFISGGYPLWELVEAADKTPDDTELSNAFLDDKVCLVFYEMLEEQAKNCDPVSCDDKGVKVYINIRKLLMNSWDADAMIAALNAKANASGTGEFFPGLYTLPDIKLPRFDVNATSLETANDVYEAYQKVFTKTFVDSVGNALKQAYDTFKGYLKLSFNPFTNFSANYAFLHNGGINGNRLLHFQYYYDFFCDLIMAYEEWRKKAETMMTMCTPPEALFPRHLLLGALDGSGGTVSKYRNHFIPSPIHSKESMYQEFLSLFHRIVRMISSLYTNMPSPVSDVKNSIDANIRITPSVIGKYALSEKSIPYYYRVLDGSPRLLDVWNPKLTAQGKETQNLHYNPSYATADFVKRPLYYDLEPYNFFRVEGHIGKNFSTVMATIQNMKQEHRLPFDVVAVTVDTLKNIIDPTKFPCHFNDLELVYESLRAELMCKLCKSLACLYLTPQRLNDEQGELKKSTRVLIKECKDALYYRDTSIGAVYEKMFPVFTSINVSVIDILGVVNNAHFRKILTTEIANTGSVAGAAATNDPSNGDVIMYFVQLTHSLVLLSGAISEKLTQYDVKKTNAAIGNVSKLMQQARDTPLIWERFTASACLRSVLELCDLAAFQIIYKEYLERIEKIKLMQSLAEFSKHHPGIQHKGGVPVGGTLVIVYRDLQDDNPDGRFVVASDFIASEAVASMPINIAASAATTAGVTNVKLKETKKYTVKEKTALTQKINTLKNKGLASLEIENILNIKLVDVLGPVKGIFDNIIANFAHGVVIADFYLPYLCCSDCPPIQFVVNIPEPKISFGLSKLEYCQEDENDEYIFQANPIGGKIVTDQQDTVVDKGDGIFAFVPAKAKIEDDQKEVSISFTYTVDNQSQTITVIVYRKPDVKIVAKEVENNPLRYNFTLEPSDMITSASWNFGDGGTSSDLSPSHTYKKGGPHTVTVDVRNGVCTGRADLQIEVKDPEPISIEVGASNICRDVNEVSIGIRPAGGRLTGEAFKESPEGSGNYIFTPSLVTMGGLSQKPVLFNYTSPQGPSKTFQIIVFEKPNGKPGAQVVGTLRIRILLSSLSHAMQARINYGDNSPEQTYEVGGATQFTGPVYQYAQGGSYIIKVTLINGTCSTPLEPVTINIEGPSQPTETRGKECQNFLAPVNSYEKLRESILQSVDFMEVYQQVMNDVEGFFKKLSSEMDAAGRINMKFFDENQIKIEWIQLLPVSPAAARTLTVQLLGIYINILTTIACLRKEDIDGNMVEVFIAIMEKLKEIRSLNARERQMIAGYINMLHEEIANVDKNNETGIKQRYLELLRELIESLQSLLNI